MRHDLPYLHLARVQLQSKTGLSIASGLSGGGYDTLLVRDANGLPALPGTAVAGVLRHLYQRIYHDSTGEETGCLFGDGEKNRESASPLHISWGVIHDSQNQPVEGLLLATPQLEEDPVLKLLAQTQPVMRDHVRLNHKGATHAQGKFDRAMLPPGCRFTLEMALWSDVKDDPRWHQVLSLFYSPRFRLGGAVRRGLGAFDVTIYQTTFNLTEKADFARFAARNRNLGSRDGLTKFPQTVPEETLTATINLVPEDFWRFGQGDAPMTQTKEGRPADQLPLHIPKIDWVQDKGQVKDSVILLPASAIKGALAHRFVFHLLRREDYQGSVQDFDPRTLPAVQVLFGAVKESNDKQEETGQAGRFLVDDICIPLPDENRSAMLGRITHNSQDRFTGGVRDGVLFSEELLFKQKFPLTVTILDHLEPCMDLTLRAALADVFADLTQGRLSLGAGSANGHGFFTGKITWSEGGNWIQGGQG